MAKDKDFREIRNVNLDKPKRERFDHLKADAVSILKGLDLGDVFIQAMALGRKEKRRVPLDDPYPLINTNTFSEEQEWLIKAVAIAETGTLDALNDPRQMLKIAEEYANGGIDILYDRVYTGAGEYAKRLEEELRSITQPQQAEVKVQSG